MEENSAQFQRSLHSKLSHEICPWLIVNKRERFFSDLCRPQPCKAVNADPWYKQHYDNLTAGISGLDYRIPECPNSILAVFGELAFPVATSSSGEVVIAAAEYYQVSGHWFEASSEHGAQMT